MLAGYEVLRSLCDGASAELLLARPEGSREQLILEVVRPELVRDPTIRVKLRREARARRRLRHPNVVRRVREGRTKEGGRFFVTEPVGETLSAVLESRGPLSIAEVVPLALALCDALDFYHRRGLVHGNVKPASVCVSGAPGALVAKLIDCGLALFRSGLRVPQGSRAPVEPEYLAPERVSGRRATPSGDLYALGVTLFEALTGSPPFTSANPDVTRRMQLEEAPPRLPPTLAKIAPILARCLAKDPDERHPSALALKDDLAALADRTTQLAPKGEVLGNYRLIRVLGEGAVGRVWLARHVKLGKQVAVKVLKPEHSENGHELERFFREARAVNQVSHPHIVEVHDFVDEPTAQGRRVYCVMELLEGATLGELLRQERVSLGRGLEAVRQVCDALGAAHAVGVVHRDVKPDNIFVTRRGGRDFAKVLDFGAAKLHGNGELGSQDVASTVVGTPCFMAPEQAQARPVDHRADVYALGGVLYLLLTGQRPFRESSLQALVEKVVHERPAPIGERTPAGERIPRALANLVLSCLAKEPEARPASMDELARALDAILSETKSSRATRLGWVIGLAVAIGGGALAAGWWLLSDRAPAGAAAAAPLEAAPPISSSPEAEQEEAPAVEVASEPDRGPASPTRAAPAPLAPAMDEELKEVVLDPFDE